MEQNAQKEREKILEIKISVWNSPPERKRP